MLKALLSLVLVATQILSGSGAMLYLCLSENGFHCVDFGPNSCTCCHSPAEQDDFAHDGCCSESAVTCDSDRSKHSKSENVAPQIVPSDSCGCTHIQITSQRSTSIFPPTSSTDVERQFQFAAVLPSFRIHDLRIDDRFDPGGIRGSLIIPSQTLIFLSSIVLRC